MFFKINNRDKDDKRRRTILIFGISSFVGSSLAEYFSKDYRVIGTYNNTPVQIPGVLCLKCDVLSKEEVQLILYTFTPEYTLYCAGLSSVLDCTEENEVAEALNMGGLFTVTDYCQRYKSQIVYFSSGYVFSGEDRDYSEKDIPDANNAYGKTKASAEFFLQKTSLNYLVLRCPQFYGSSINGRANNFFEVMQRKILKNEVIGMDANVEIGFLDVYFLGMILKLAFDRGIQNRMIQVSSSDYGTYYDFGKLYAEVFKSEAAISKSKWPFPILVSGSVAQSSGMLHYRMDVKNLSGLLSIELPTIRESLEFSKKRLNSLTEGKAGAGGDELKFI